MEPVRTAVVGLGYWGPKLVRNLVDLRDASLEWACDIDPAAVARIERRHAKVKGTTRFADVLSDPAVEAVMIATPPATHHELGVLALDAGKHVFVEKPLATSVADALVLVALARSRDLVLMPGHTFLYSPPVTVVRDLIRSGYLGDIWSISTSRVNLGRHRLETSVTWDLGPHDFSILRYWLDELPIDVAALSRDFVVAGTHDVAFINMRYASGAVAHVELSWLAPRKLRRTTIVGSKRMVVYDDASRVPVRVHDYGVTFENGKGSSPDRPAYRTGSVFAPPVDAVEPLSLELRDFCKAIRLRAPLRTTPELAIDVLRCIEAVDRSLARRGEREPLGPAALAVA